MTRLIFLLFSPVIQTSESQRWQGLILLKPSIDSHLEMSCNMTGYVRHPQYRTNRKCCEDSKWRSWKIHLVAKRSSSNYPTGCIFLATDFFPGCILLDKFPDAIPFHPVEEYEPVVSVLSGHLQWHCVQHEERGARMPGCQDASSWGRKHLSVSHPKKVSVNSVNFEFINFLVGGDWNHGIFHDFPFSWEVPSIPTGELHHFHRGRYTTNQLWLLIFRGTRLTWKRPTFDELFIQGRSYAQSPFYKVGLQDSEVVYTSCT